MAFSALVVCFVNVFAIMLCFDVIPDNATDSVNSFGLARSSGFSAGLCEGDRLMHEHLYLVDDWILISLTL